MMLPVVVECGVRLRHSDRQLRRSRESSEGKASAERHPAVKFDEERDRWLRCARCSSRIARQRDILPTSDPPVYANPAGRVFALILVARAINLRAVGEETLRFTWFSGYTWSTGMCAHCGSHLGWRFVAYRPDAVRDRFYGLLRDAVTGAA